MTQLMIVGLPEQEIGESLVRLGDRSRDGRAPKASMSCHRRSLHENGW